MKYITTYTGKTFDYEHLEANEYNIHDIVQGLSNLCRFAGQIKNFYSVAQHTCRMYDQALEKKWPKAARQYILLHDAPEAYMVDVPSPLKSLLPDYQRLEARVFEAILRAFNWESLSPGWISNCIQLDKDALVSEKFFLKNSKQNVRCWKPKRAAREYRKRLYREFN